MHTGSSRSPLSSDYHLSQCLVLASSKEGKSMPAEGTFDITGAYRCFFVAFIRGWFMPWEHDGFYLPFKTQDKGC